uniref:Probable ATP-dependent RNA helicase DHX34 n=1 Tax=Psoroptes ovis TaxID=83912 RepID=A0A3B0QQB5_PSOOV|nr:probable ATP-dependent RNA helicase DHX34 [Psoroptes ovis]
MSFQIFRNEKHNLNQLFFNHEYCNFSSLQINEFWTFFEKFSNRTKTQKSTINYEQLIVKLSDKIPIEWINIDDLFDKSLHKLTLNDLKEFRNILLIFVDFIEKRKEKKLAKLKEFQQNLPIHEYKEIILEKIRTNSVVLIAGDTGCGKSTQVPQYLLHNGYQRICCTQPRRIACIALCNRLKIETADRFGMEIGFQIRFEKKRTKHTKIIFMTEGLLLRQMIEDPLLSDYDVIILDEIHERHLSSDFLMGAIKCLLYKRKDNLKVILMSATVNCDLFSGYFGNCLVIQVPGRLYPIKTEYFPPDKVNIFKAQSKIDPEPYLKILQLIDLKFPSTERGDVLIFLSGFAEIEFVGEKLKEYGEQNQRWIILYLHSALSLDEQDKVFDITPDGVRKCILSTNIAETSITIDGIRFVIDSGKMKEMYYEPAIRMHRLQEIWVSKASAEQRKGRAGRTGPGICYRLYSQNDFDNFDDFSKPEIQRVSLESLILNMITMGLKDVRKFPFIQPPSETIIENTLKYLINYGTLDSNENVTDLGKILSKLPVDIPIGKLLVLAICVGHHHFVLSMAACLSVQSMTTIRSRNDREMREQRKSFISKDGDPFSILNFYKHWLLMKSAKQNTRKWCQELGLEEQRFHEITKLRKQFEDILIDSGLIDSKNNEKNDDGDFLTRSERIARNGERKLLRKMKIEMEQNNQNKKRKLLRMDNNNDDDDNHRKINENDLKELEFNLLFQSHYFKDNEKKHSIREDEYDLIKAIIISSFYPQMSIADVDNSYQFGSDQMFHTKEKPFVVLHPSSIYYIEPELLKSSSSIESSEKGNLCKDHYLLGYLSLIETNKSYIYNCYRLSAIHVLTLCSQQIDTDDNCSRMVFDDWIEINFKYYQEGQDMLISAYKIRQKFEQLLSIICNESNSNETNDHDQMKKNLNEEIKSFMKYRCKYSLKRLLSADLKIIYTNHQISLDELIKMNDGNKIQKFLIRKHEKLMKKSKIIVNGNTRNNKGGFQHLFINFNCLKRTDDDELPINDNRRWFQCKECQQKMHVTPIEQARHEDYCSGKQQNNEDDDNNKSKTMMNIETTSNTKSTKHYYYCNDCRKEIWLSNIDILRHRQQHSSNNDDDQI